MAALGGSLILVGFGLALLALAALLFPKWFVRKETQTPKQMRLGGVAVLVLSLGSCMAGGALTPSSPASTAPQAGDGPQAVEKPAGATLHSITRVDGVKTAKVVDQGTLQLEVALPEGWDGPSYLDQAGLKVAEVGKALQQGAKEFSPGVQAVEFLFSVPTVDRLGKEGRHDFMNATFSASDLRQAKFENIGIAGTLDLVQDARAYTFAQSDAATWCAKPDNAGVANGFCTKLGLTS